MVDSSFKEVPDPIQWGYLNCFAYESPEGKLFFTFVENDGNSIFRFPDSLIVSDLKSRLTDTPKKGKLSTINKIENNKILGFWGQFEDEETRVSRFEGEAPPVQLFLSIIIYQKKTGQPLPDILGDVLKTLQIQVSDQ
jgi:hypothetical protein